MRIGDIIIEVDGIVISRDNYDELGRLLKKEPGSEIQVIIIRDGSDEKIIFNLECEEIEIKNLSYFGFVPENSNNAYLKLSGFSRPAGEEIRKALVELKEQKEIKTTILDLRGNPGGLLDAAINVCEKFLKKGELVVSVKGREKDDFTEYLSAEEPISGDSRLVVLVDDGSASASEIVAGAIQDHDRGVILGTQSFGKGLVQTLIPLSYNTSLKITTGKYFTPSGRCIQKIDYTAKNKVFENPQDFENEQFKTDNERLVYSRGGIQPDTVVSNDSESNQVKNLLAQGMFFRFATNYFNNSSEKKINGITDDELFNEFLFLLKKENYSYTSKTEKLLLQLKQESEKYYENKLKNEIQTIESKLLQLKINELEDYRNDIVSEIRKELAARIKGRKGRIEEQLKNDRQFEVAYNILNNDRIYKELLNSSD